MNFAPREGLALQTGTPVSVAANSYNISYPCCKYSKQHYVPFLTFCKRKQIKTPCYTHALYDPPARQRIRYGNSLQYTAPRVTVNVDKEPLPNEEKTKSPYIPRFTKRNIQKGYPGKVYLCRVEFTTGISTPCIPNHKNYNGYDINEDDELIKVPAIDHDNTLGPAFYEIPRGELNYNSTKYNGCKWSAMKGQRSKLVSNTNPGPDHYDVKFVKCVRHKDDKVRALMRKCCNVPKYTCQLICESKNEGRPGPGDYEIVDLNKIGRIKNYCLGPKRTAERFTYKCEVGPGPQTYNVCDCYKHRKDFSLKKGIPFFGEALRFPIKKVLPSPGPDAYDAPAVKCVRYRGTRRSFNSTAERKLQAEPNNYPAPCTYDIPLKGLPCCSREPKVRSSVFSSLTCRFKRPKDQEEPDPATYSIAEAFKCNTDKRSHATGKRAAFNASEGKFTRIYDFAGVSTGDGMPDPATYSIAEAFKCNTDKRSHATGKRAAFNASEGKFTRIYDFAGVSTGVGMPGVGDYDLPPLQRQIERTIPYAKRFPVSFEMRPGPQTYSVSNTLIV